MSPSLDRAQALAAHLRSRLQGVVLGTSSSAGEPLASTAPAVVDQEGRFGLCLSGLAEHTRNLLARPRASVLLLGDLPEHGSPFARPRLTFPCHARLLPRPSPEALAVLAQLRAAFGPSADLVAGLPDAHVFQLIPERGRLVAGFGAAYDVDPGDWTRLSPVGAPPPR